MVGMFWFCRHASAHSGVLGKCSGHYQPIAALMTGAPIAAMAAWLINDGCPTHPVLVLFPVASPPPLMFRNCARMPMAFAAAAAALVSLHIRGLMPPHDRKKVMFDVPYVCVMFPISARCASTHRLRNTVPAHAVGFGPLAAHEFPLYPSFIALIVEYARWRRLHVEGAVVLAEVDDNSVGVP